ncbi:MAG: NUDIX domain-containing protein [Bacteroidota bacterium]
MPGIVSRIVEVVVFRFTHDRPEYLLLRRAREEKIYPGMWQIITGKVREGETAVQAARRELLEETRISPERFWVLPYTGTFYDPGMDAIQISPFFAAQAPEQADPVLSNEHAAFRWLSVEEASRMLVWTGQREGLRLVHECIVGGGEASGLALLPPD